MTVPTCIEIQNNILGLSNISKIKTGGQKVVYKADHVDYGPIVLKIVLSSKADRRVKREIEIVQKNQFPNVPVIFDCDIYSNETHERLYILEQYVDGEDLRSRYSDSLMGFHNVIEMLRSLLNTTKLLEEQKIVHRDIKPDNILEDSSGQYWLIDFGIARDLNQISLTASNANLGPHTAGYAAPEQFRNLKKKIDSRADLFSIGVLTYELLTGEHPFTSGANGMIDVLLRTETIQETPLDIPQDIHGELSQFIRTLMQKGQVWRPPSAKVAYDWFMEIYGRLK